MTRREFEIWKWLYGRIPRITVVLMRLRRLYVYRGDR
jgi:hypothetical protein